MLIYKKIYKFFIFFVFFKNIASRRGFHTYYQRRSMHAKGAPFACYWFPTFVGFGHRSADAVDANKPLWRGFPGISFLDTFFWKSSAKEQRFRSPFRGVFVIKWFSLRKRGIFGPDAPLFFKLLGPLPPQNSPPFFGAQKSGKNGKAYGVYYELYFGRSIDFLTFFRHGYLIGRGPPRTISDVSCMRRGPPMHRNWPGYPPDLPATGRQGRGKRGWNHEIHGFVTNKVVVAIFRVF